MAAEPVGPLAAADAVDAIVELALPASGNADSDFAVSDFPASVVSAFTARAVDIPDVAVPDAKEAALAAPDAALVSAPGLAARVSDLRASVCPVASDEGCGAAGSGLATGSDLLRSLA